MRSVLRDLRPPPWVLGLLFFPSAVLAQSAMAGEGKEHPALQACVDASGFAASVVVRTVPGGMSWVGGGERSTTAVLPASTFKIVSALVSLEEGVVGGPDALLAWDRVPTSRPELHRDLTLREAFRLSAVPHFQGLVRSIGPARMQEWLQRLSYGNESSEGTPDRFWLDGGLRISPLDQVDFLERLVRGELPVSEASRTAVLDLMEFERVPGAEGRVESILRAKTGYATPPGEGAVGWWVGAVERGENVHLFATLLMAEEEVPGLLEARMSVSRCALQALGVWEPAPEPDRHD